MPEVGILAAAAVSEPFELDAWKERFGSRFRRVGPYVQVAQLAAARVLEPLDRLPAGLGVYLGTGMANLATIQPLMEGIRHPTAPRCSPLAFARSVGNAAAFFVAQAFGIEGESVTVSQEGLAFEAALLEAWLALQAGTVGHALVGGLDVRLPEADDTAQRVRIGAVGAQGETTSGAAFLLLGPGGAWALDGVRVGRFDPLEATDGLRILRGWAAQGLEVPDHAPAAELRLTPTASALSVAEAVSTGPRAPFAHVQRDSAGTWGRIVARPR